MVKGAVRTDFILSAEIMAIALNEVKSLAETSIWLEAGVLAFVAIAITIAVYGAVGLIVKMDDIGLHMAQRENGASQAIGRGLVKAMPKLLNCEPFFHRNLGAQLASAGVRVSCTQRVNSIKAASKMDRSCKSPVLPSITSQFQDVHLISAPYLWPKRWAMRARLRQENTRCFVCI
jgi:predicted DNA repair protein MutK